MSLHASAQPAPSLNMGKGLFGQEGANSCSYCHGIDGKGGKVKEAVNLTTPKTWKSYKGIGEAAFAKNKAEALKQLEESVEHTILKGALIHNSSFKRPWFDWKKAGGPFNSQMLGLSGAPSKAWLAKYKEKGVTPEIAAKAVFNYIKTLDTQGVFK